MRMHRLLRSVLVGFTLLQSNLFLKIPVRWKLLCLFFRQDINTSVDFPISFIMAERQSKGAKKWLIHRLCGCSALAPIVALLLRSSMTWTSCFILASVSARKFQTIPYFTEWGGSLQLSYRKVNPVKR